MVANLCIDVLRYAATVHMGGASPTTALQNAAMAIASGLCNHVLVTLGWNGYSALRSKPGAPPTRAMNMNTLTNTIQGYYIPYGRSEEHTSELQSLMRIPYAVFCLKKK